MTRSDEFEAAAVLRRLLPVMVSAANEAASPAAASLRQTVGNLSANAESKLRAWNFGAELASAFQAATAARGTFASFGRVAAAARAEAPFGAAARAIVQVMLRLALVEQSAAISSTKFRSRSEVDAVLTTVNVTFGEAEEYAADEGEEAFYRALVSLHGAVVRDLGQRARPLPQLVTLTSPVSRPVLALANRLYGDASRADEIVAENAIVHPLFAPRTIRALSA